MDYTFMQNKFREILVSSPSQYKEYIVRLLVQTRDIESGKGLYNLTYYLLEVLHNMVYTTEEFNKGLPVDKSVIKELLSLSPKTYLGNLKND